MSDARPVPETEVPPGEIPAGRCPHCDRPFRDERRLLLHRREAHEATLSDDDRDRIERAREVERDQLFLYQLKVTIALGLIYSGSALSAMFLLGG